MDPKEALRVIRGLAKANRLRFTAHAAREAVECGATGSNALRVGERATDILGRSSDWTVMGPDLDDDDLEVAVILEDGVLIITVY